MKTIERDRFTHWQEIDSTEEIIRLAETDPADHPQYARSGYSCSAEFTGSPSMADAIKLAREGWQDAPDLRHFAAAINARGEEGGTAQGMEHAVTGAFVDVSRYLEGHPENMLEFTETPAPRSVRIAINLWNTAYTSREIFAYRGAIAIALADALSRAGMNVEILATNVHEGRDTDALAATIFPLKRAQEPLDIAAIAFWTCHPSALRRLLFAAMDHYDDGNRRRFRTGPRHGDGYGTLAETLGDGLEKTIPGIDFLINCHAATEENAVDYLNKYAAILNQ